MWYASTLLYTTVELVVCKYDLALIPPPHPRSTLKSRIKAKPSTTIVDMRSQLTSYFKER